MDDIPLGNNEIKILNRIYGFTYSMCKFIFYYSVS